MPKIQTPCRGPLLFPVLSLVFLAAGCSTVPPATDTAATVPAPGAAVERSAESPLVRGERMTALLLKESLGPLRLNEPEKDVLAALGEPRKRSDIFHLEA